MSVASAASPYESLGRPIHGPGALTGDWRRFWHLTFNIARHAVEAALLRLRARLSVAAGPAAAAVPGAVRVLHQDRARRRRRRARATTIYGAQLLASIVLFTFFGEATIGAVRSVVDNETLVRKIQFPRMVIPLSVVLLALFNLCLNLIVVTIFALIAGVRPMLTWLEVPLIVGAAGGAVRPGIAMLLSALFVYFRDIQPIWEVRQPGHLLRLADHHPDRRRSRQNLSPTLVHLYMLNPLAVVFQQFRHAFITHATPSAGALFGPPARRCWRRSRSCVAIFVLGFWVFNRIAPRVAEDL